MGSGAKERRGREINCVGRDMDGRVDGALREVNGGSDSSAPCKSRSARGSGGALGDSGGLGRIRDIGERCTADP